MRPVPNESKIPSGTLLVGKYRVTREIGRGGMAAVYEAEQTSLNKKVAVKVLASELSASTIVIERFFREARAAASIRSPYIVDVYDSGRLEDGRPFICMELLEGESLYDRMARIRLIDPETTVRVITQCAKGLLKAHAAGIVHRDLKPENIFITKPEEGDEVSKLLDFGLAKFYEPVAPDQKTARLTREGAVFGTPAYMSPEQVKGQGSVDHRADLWALGCMAFECLIGRPVWNTDQGVAMTFAAIATAPIPVPSKLRPDLPTSFDEWFAKALERDPDKRFQTAKELAEALIKAFGKPPSISMINATDLSELEQTVAMERPPLHVPDTVVTGPMELHPEARAAAMRAAGGQAGREASFVGAGNTGGYAAQQVAGNAGYSGGYPQQGGAPYPMESSQARALGYNGRQQGPSISELSTMARPPSMVSSSQVVPLPPPSPLRWVLSSAALVGTSIAAFIVWSHVLRPQVFNPIVVSTASASQPVAPPSGTASSAPPADEPKWLTAAVEGQKLFSGGDTPGALHKLKESMELGGGNLAKGLIEQMKSVQGSRGRCKVAALSHPRIGTPGSVGRPTIATVERGTLVTWTDDHEQSGHDHAWSVVLDEVGRPTSRPRDLTPEANEVGRTALLTVNDRAVLLYWDRSGREAGVRVRWLDPDGRIGGASMLVGAGRNGNFWPSMDRAPDGFYVVWADDRDKEGDDIFLRKLSSDLETQGSEIRLTDYLSVGGRNANARVPAVAVAAGTVFVTYKLEREPQHTIARMRIPMDTPELQQKGLEERGGSRSSSGSSKGGGLDRELGDVAIVNEDKLPGDAPVIACGAEGCFIAWHGEKGGAYAAMVEPAGGRVLWRKKMGDKTSHPSIGVGQDGVVELAYFDGGRLKMAQLTRDGVGGSSVMGRVTGDQPRPSIAPGRSKGEWVLAWQDQESGHTEAYASRVTCSP
jgi:serine/threonine protein kinase